MSRPVSTAEAHLASTSAGTYPLLARRTATAVAPDRATHIARTWRAANAIVVAGKKHRNQLVLTSTGVGDWDLLPPWFTCLHLGLAAPSGGIEASGTNLSRGCEGSTATLAWASKTLMLVSWTTDAVRTCTAEILSPRRRRTTAHAAACSAHTCRTISKSVDIVTNCQFLAGNWHS